MEFRRVVRTRLDRETEERRQIDRDLDRPAGPSAVVATVVQVTPSP
jgi:hypothetical protein